MSTQDPINYTFVKTASAFHFTKEYMLQAYNFANETWPEVPPMKIYSAMQQFIPFSFYENFLLQSIEKRAMDTILDKSWSTNDFKFIAGDLFPVFENLN